MEWTPEARKARGEFLRLAREKKKMGKYEDEAAALVKLQHAALGDPKTAPKHEFNPKESPAELRARILARELEANTKLNPQVNAPQAVASVGYRVEGVTCSCGCTMQLQSQKRMQAQGGVIVQRLKYECLGTGTKAGCGRWVSMNVQEVGR